MNAIKLNNGSKINQIKIDHEKDSRQNNHQTKKIAYYQNQGLRIFAEKECLRKLREVKLAKSQCRIIFNKINCKQTKTLTEKD